MRVERQTGWLEALTVYFTRRQLIIFVMAFSSGLPLLLTLSTLTYWLTKSGVDLTTIGLSTLLGSPYTYKFALAPIIDQIRLPGLGRMGRRKSWLFVLQLCLAASIFAMGQTDPAIDLMPTLVVTFIMAIFAASQDIVVDAYRIEILAAHEQGAGAGTTQVGYRIGMLLASAGALSMSDFLPWTIVFSVLAGAILLCAIFTLFVPEPATKVVVSVKRRDFKTWIREAVIEPFGEFMTRKGWLVILCFILFYKFGDAFGGAMATPFYAKIGFSGTEIGAISKVFGLIATLVGGLIGGLIVVKFGIFRTLLIGGILQAVTNLLFSVLAIKGHDIIWLGVAITADNIAGGIASAAFVAYLSGLCNVAYTATQYALLTSFMAQGRTLMASGSGWLATQMDWVSFWALTALMAIPGLLLLLWIARLYPQGLMSRPK